MNNGARRAASWLVWSLPFLLALVYSSAFAASFSAPKNAIFVASSFALAGLALTFISPGRQAKEERILWFAIAAYLSVPVISAMRSQGSFSSFKSLNFAEFLSICFPVLLPICGVMLFASSRAVLSGEDRVLNARRLLMAISLAAVLVSLVVVAQFFGAKMPGALQPDLSFSNRMRLVGTLGNPDFVAAFLAVALPTAIGLSLMERAGRAAGRCLWILASALIVVAIVLTGSRGGLMALTVGVAVTLIAQKNACSQKGTFSLKIICWPLLLVVGLACALAAGRELNSRSLGESLRGRLFIWQVTLGGHAAQSELGSGPGSFAYDYPTQLGQFFGQPGHRSLLRFAGREVHAQNDFVEAWHETGWLGAGSLGMVLAVWFGIAIRRLRSADGEERPVIAAATASVAAVCVAALVDCPMHRAETSALLWLSMAMGLASPIPLPINGRLSWLRYSGAALLFVGGCTLAFAPLAASHDVARGQLEEEQERPALSEAAYRAALRWEPSSPDANFNLVRSLAEAGETTGALAQSITAGRYVREPELCLLRSRILRNADRNIEAQHEVEEGLRIFPYSKALRDESLSFSRSDTKEDGH